MVIGSYAQFSNLNRTPRTQLSGLARRQKTASLSGNTKLAAHMKDFKKGLAHLKKQVDLVGRCPIFCGPQTEAWATQSVTLRTTGSVYDRYAPISMQVEQIARGQLNHGFALDETGLAFDLGPQQFEVETGDGTVHTVSVEVLAGDTNRGVQEKMAQAVTAADIGIQGTVSAFEGRTTLQFQSQGLGDDAVTFSVRDCTGSRLIYASGTQTVSNMPQNARYTVNGVSHESTTNHVDLGGGVQAELIGTSGNREFSIDDGFHEINAQNMLNSVTNALNYLMETAQTIRQSGGMDTLELELSLVVDQFSSATAQLGTVRNEKGFLDFDPVQLSKSYETGGVRDFFQHYLTTGKGVLKGLDQWAQNLTRDLFGGHLQTWRG